VRYDWNDAPKYMRVRKQWNTGENRSDVYFDLGVLEGDKIKWTQINGKSIKDPAITENAELLVGLAVGLNATAKFSQVTLFHEYDSSLETEVSKLTQPPEDPGGGDPGGEDPDVIPVPTGLTAFAKNRQVYLSWQAVTGDVVYKVKRSTVSGGPYTTIAEEIPGGSPVYLDDGLTNYETYHYVVSVVKDGQEGEYSAEVSAKPRDFIISDNYEDDPLGEMPKGYSSLLGQSEINNLAVVNTRDIDSRKSKWYTDGDMNNIAPEIVGNNTNVLWVNDKADAGRRGSFVVDFAPVTGGITLQQNGSDRITGTSYLDKKLWNGVTYYYRLTAGNVGGMGSSAVTAVAASAALQAPVLISAESGDGSIHLSWTSVARATQYIVSRSLTNGGPYAELATVGSTEYVDTNVDDGQTYYYVVTAVSGSQTSMLSNQLKARPYDAAADAPGRVTGLWAVADSGRVSLEWQAAPGAEQYRVKRNTTSGGPYSTIATADGTAFVDTDVTNGTTYYYVVAAVNAAGEGGESDEIAVLPAKILTVDKMLTADNVTVFDTIQAAVDAVPANNTERVIIHIAPGVYEEKLKVTKPYVSLVGSGMDVTKITWGDYAGTPSTVGQPGHVGNTFLSQTVEVDADYFTAANLTIENSAGPRSKVAQAVALSLKSNQASFESVRLIGHQDTLYNGLRNNGGMHYFHNSIIQGDVDFIFGEAPAVVMDNVRLVLVSHEGGGGHITAGAQRNLTDPGYVFFNSHIVDDASAKGNYDLGRPWKDYARVTFINTNIDSDNFIPGGWVSSCAGSCKEAFFSEYNSYGPGAIASMREIPLILTGEEASLTIPRILGGWDPATPVIMPKVQYMPEVVTTYAVYDKSASDPQDIHVIVKGYGQALKAIRNGDQTLSLDDYEVRGNVYSIRGQYLAKQPDGRLRLTFEFEQAEAELTIHVTGSPEMAIGREVLTPNDGWASYGNVTIGGANAAPSQVHIVENRSQLLAALGGSNNSVPKIIYIKGVIDMNVDDDNNPVNIDYYMDPAYNFDEYLKTYDPEVWGWDRLPSGPLEEARAASQKKQGDRIKIPVGSNTTIVGLPGTGATIRGGNLVIQNVSNVIVRNIRFENTFDYFPQWDPTDGEFGNWNSEYDSISIKNATNVWIDHNTFTDGGRQGYPYYFGRKYQMYDGFLDITNGADLVTVSYNVFENHDKVSLVGGSDSYTADEGKLRVTFHHNYYRNVGQRLPRVRYGQVHLYNNYYEGSYHADDPFLYAIGVGFKSQVYAENNYFVMDPDIPLEALIQINNGTSFTDVGTLLNGVPVSISQAYPQLSRVDWKPVLFTRIDDTSDVPAKVLANAGADSSELADVRAPMWLAGAKLTVRDVTTNSVTLEWTPAYDNLGVTGYKVYRLTGSAEPELLAELEHQATSYRVTGLSANTVYTFAVRAYDAAGLWSSIQADVRTSSGGGGTSGPGPQPGAGGGTTQPGSEDGTGSSGQPTSIDKAAQVTTGDGKRIVTMNPDALSELISEAAEDAAQFTLYVESGQDEVQVQLTTEILDVVAGHRADAVLQIETDQGSFYLPVGLLDLSRLAEESGVTVDDLKITVTISKPDDNVTAAFHDAARELGAALLSEPLMFTLTVEAGDGEAFEIDEFTTYVARVIKLDDAVNASTAAGVMYDPVSGTITPVPTVFNGQEAIMLRPGNSIYAVIEHSKTFADLTGHWSRRDVELMANKLIVRGVSEDRFAPDQHITRAEFAALLVRALGLTEKALDAFDDVTAADWFYGAVGAAAEAGLVTGFTDGSFRPHEKITREQMATMVARALRFAGYDAAATTSVLSRYADAGSVSTWAAPSMAEAVSEGIITGTSATTLSPKALATRAEAAVMVKRMMQVLNFIQS